MNFDSIVNQCRYLLNNSPVAEDILSYLDTRVSKEAQEFFEFGFFPGNQNINLLTNTLGEATLREAQLLYSREFQDSIGARSLIVSFFEHWPLVMPYKDLYGNTIALVGRSILGDEERKVLNISKYKNTTFEKGQHLFGLFEAKKYIMEQGFVYVVEGQFDVIKAWERGIRNVVALGNSNMTDYQFSLLLRYTDNILLLLDNDEAGKKGRSRAIAKYNKLADIKNIYLPKGYKDIDECLKSTEGNYLPFVLNEPEVSSTSL